MRDDGTPRREQQPGSEKRKLVRFFDSHGGLWETCGAEDQGAKAFGPFGTAKQIDPEVVGLKLTDDERTPYSAAKKMGRVIEKEEDTDWVLLSE